MSKKPLFMQVNHFWDTYKRAPQTVRNGLVTRFIEELQISGYALREIHSIPMRHPSIRRKDKRSRFTTLEILADFIMDIDMMAERESENPVLNPEGEYNREQKRKKREIEYFDEYNYRKKNPKKKRGEIEQEDKEEIYFC